MTITHIMRRPDDHDQWFIIPNNDPSHGQIATTEYAADALDADGQTAELDESVQPGTIIVPKPKPTPFVRYFGAILDPAFIETGSDRRFGHLWPSLGSLLRAWDAGYKITIDPLTGDPSIERIYP